MATESSNGSGTDALPAGRRGAAATETATFTGLLAEPRRMKILEWLQEEGSARVRELSQAFKVSEATIRQDLERLEGVGPGLLWALHRAGIAALADLASLEPEGLAARLGPLGRLVPARAWIATARGEA